MKTIARIFCKKFILISLFLSIGFTLWSQNFQLTGIVMDENKKSMDLANVLLLNPSDSSYMAGTMSNENGHFKIGISSGRYLLHIRMLGYKSAYIPFELTENKYLGNIILESEYTQMQEVVITGTRPIIKREIDRIVFDVSNSPSSIGGSALDVMRDVPGLIVGQNSLQMFGKGTIKIYINDRESKLSGSELINYLRSYNASEIGKVEVITTPPAKYDAEGNAGIINIRLKARKQDFFGGSVFSGFNLAETDSYGNSGINLNFNQNRISAFLNSSANYGHYAYMERNDKYYTEMTRKSNTYAKNYIPSGNIEGGVDVALENDWIIGLQGTYNKSEPHATICNHTSIYSPVAVYPDSTITSVKKQNYSNDRMNLNFHLDKTLDKAGKKMMLDLDYLNFQKNEKDGFRSQMHYPDGSEIPQTGFNYDNLQTQKSSVLSSKLDFILPFRTFSLNTGAKVSFTDTRNQISYDNSGFRYAQDDLFLYTENIFALYADFNKKFNSLFTIKLGLRMEHTYTKGDSESENQVDKKNYTRLFPTGFLMYNLNENHVFNLNFSNRISRPASNMINPFVTYENEYTSYSGKADLQPYYTYNTELGYTFKNNLNFGVFCSYADNVFTQLTTMDSVNFTSSTIWDNYITYKTAGIRSSYTLKLNWLQSYIDQRLNYQKSISDSPVTPPEGSGWTYNISLNNTFYFNKQKTVIGTLSGNYGSKQYRNTSVFEPTYSINAGLKYSLLDNKLNISFNVYDIIYSNMKGTLTSNGMKMSINNTFSVTTYRIGVSYNFGKNIATKKRNYSNSDIQPRL